MFIDSLPPPEKRIESGTQFSFTCHDDLSCFNTCCRNKHLPLTPYDVLRLKKGLELYSDTFLEKYVVYRIDEKSGFPVLSLRMAENSEKSCPFVQARGCSLYQDRPTACRLFPLGRSVGISHKGSGSEAFYYFLDIPGCQGFRDEKRWSIEAWQENQGLREYIQMNDRMLGLVFHPERNRAVELSEHQLQMIMIACYNLDVFREMVFQTNFLQIFAVDEETSATIKHNDTALLDLGLRYLNTSLFRNRE